MPSSSPDERVSEPLTPDGGAGDAAEAYRARTAALKEEERRLQREHQTLGYVRLAFGLAIAVLLVPPKLWVLLPLVCFVVAARIHQRVLARLAAARRSLAFYQHGMARLEDCWSGLRPRKTPSDAGSSLYASDLDLFGAGSLFEFVCEARTTLGEDTLAGWLLSPASSDEVRRRQGAVKDLRGRLQVREAFAVAPGPVLASLDRESLSAWGTHSVPVLPKALRWIAPVLVLLTLGAAWRYGSAGTPLLLIVSLMVNLGLTFSYKGAYEAAFLQAEQASRSLRTASALLRAVEQETFEAESLREAQATLSVAGQKASDALEKLARLMVWAEARSNYVVRILDAPFLYSLQMALALQEWREHYGTALHSWLETLGSFEALLSFAGYSFEHPADTFPALKEGPAHLVAAGLGHPLLPEAQCVRNDVSLDDRTRLLLVSGSNMSGKSTLLRSVGINAVLAFAGAPVRARSLSLSRLTLGASIQVSDSLQAGRSRFYAEILRLRAITEAASRSGPVLFLIDEVLAGTNSSDRLAGARGLVSDLLRHGAIGLLSTHDLALTGISVDPSGSAIRNVHFEDEIIEGQLRFSYQLHDGVVERSNGLALMRLIGLDV